MNRLQEIMRRFADARRQKNVLLVESDDLGTATAICQIDHQRKIKVCGFCKSTQGSLSTALGDSLARLGAAGHAEIPSQAILLSPYVQTAILNLPVNPKSPLPPANMQQLVKWELEPYLSNNKARRIGAILVARGYISWDELDALLIAAQGSSGDVDGGTRLGELAIQRGLITESQLEECLVVQKTVQDFSGEAVCGWSPLDATENGKWKWLVCGTTRTFRQHACDAFAGHNLQLRAIYPLVGCASASMNGTLGRSNAIFEYNAGHLSFSRFADKKVANSRTMFTHEAGNPIRSCLDLFEGNPDKLWLAGRWPDSATAAAELQSQLKIPCYTIAHDEKQIASKFRDQTFDGLLGAASHHFAMASPGCVVCVPAKDHRTPLTKDWRAIAIAISVLATMLILTMTLIFKSQRSSVIDSIELAEAVENSQIQLANLQQRIDNMNWCIAFAENDLPRRRSLLPRMLSMLEKICPEEVIISRVQETTDAGVTLTGWGLSAKAIQAFKIDLEKQLPDVTISDGSNPVREAIGYQSLPGYSFEWKMRSRVSSGGRK